MNLSWPLLGRDLRDMELLWLRGDRGRATGREMVDLVEFRDEDREADLEWKCDLGSGGDWNWSQNSSGDSVVLSRELEGLLELLTVLGLGNSRSLTCSSEI